MEAAFLPEVNDELDTQNFEKFEEVQKSIVINFYLMRWAHFINDNFGFAVW